MGLKSFLLKQVLKRQMKGVPESQRDMIISAVEKNPKLFEDIAKEVEALTKQGKDQMSATMEVMRKHQAELQAALK
jgi:hypothetical protein